VKDTCNLPNASQISRVNLSPISSKSLVTSPGAAKRMAGRSKGEKMRYVSIPEVYRSSYMSGSQPNRVIVEK
jgi:hypothetical protein